MTSHSLSEYPVDKVHRIVWKKKPPAYRIFYFFSIFFILSFGSRVGHLSGNPRAPFGRLLLLLLLGFCFGPPPLRRINGSCERRRGTKRSASVFLLALEGRTTRRHFKTISTRWESLVWFDLVATRFHSYLQSASPRWMETCPNPHSTTITPSFVFNVFIFSLKNPT